MYLRFVCAFRLLKQKTGNAIRALGRMAILSANSRRGPTTIGSSPTSSPSHPSVLEPPPTIDFEGEDESRSPCISTAEGKNGRGAVFLDASRVETNVYSFCYKTEMNILPEESEANSPLDGFSNVISSLKSEEPTTEDVSTNGETIRETDTSKETNGLVQKTDGSPRPTEESARPMERIEEEETEIRIVEERVSKKGEEASSIERSLIDDVRPKSVSSAEEGIDFSGTRISCKRESWSVEDEDEDEDEEERRKEEKGDIVGEIERELKEKMDQEAGGSASSQKIRRVFRGDSRDSGIGDCASNLSASSQQVNELGISAIKEEEADNESNNNNSNKGLLEKLERFEDRGTLLVDIGEISADVKVSDPKRHNKGSIEVAALSGVNKASREINRQHEGVFFQCVFPFFLLFSFFLFSITLDHERIEIGFFFSVAGEIEDPRLLIGRIRSKFVPTGNVSRTAKLFEKEAAAAAAASTKSASGNVPQASERGYPSIATKKPNNERIQKAFAFWNK